MLPALTATYLNLLSLVLQLEKLYIPKRYYWLGQSQVSFKGDIK
jgi:hypothetical protein